MSLNGLTQVIKQISLVPDPSDPNPKLQPPPTGCLSNFVAQVSHYAHKTEGHDNARRKFS